MEDLYIKALNSDNSAELRTLTAFVDAQGGTAYPFADLCSARFWRAHTGSRFITLLLFRSASLLGTFSLRPIKTPSGTALELLFPLFSGENLSATDELPALLTAILKKQAGRIGATHLLSFTPAECGTKFRSLKDLFGLTESAVLPLRAQPDFDGEVVFYLRSLATQHVPELPASTIFVPDHHHRFIARLCERTSLARMISSKVSNALPRKTRKKNLLGGESNISFSKGGAPCTSFVLRRFHARLTLIEPEVCATSESTLSNTISTFEAINPALNHFLAINICRPEAVPLIPFLESQGYRLCGLIPVRYGGDYLFMRRPYEKKNNLAIHSEELLSESDIARYITKPVPIREIKPDAYAA